MKKSAISVALTPIHNFINALTLRITICESRHERQSEIPTLKANIAGLRQDVSYQRFINFNDLMRMDEDRGSATTSEIPLDTTGDVKMGEIVDRSSDT